MSDIQQAGGWALRAASRLLLEGAPCLARASDPLKAQEVEALPSRVASGCLPALRGPLQTRAALPLPVRAPRKQAKP